MYKYGVHMFDTKGDDSSCKHCNIELGVLRRVPFGESGNITLSVYSSRCKQIQNEIIRGQKLPRASLNEGQPDLFPDYRGV